MHDYVMLHSLGHTTAHSLCNYALDDWTPTLNEGLATDVYFDFSKAFDHMLGL